MTQFPLPRRSLRLVAMMAMSIGPLLHELLMRPRFLGVVSRMTVAMLSVLCLSSRLTVVMRAFLAVSTGLRMNIRWLMRLAGTWLVHAEVTRDLLLWITLRNLILVAGTRWSTLPSTLRLVCRTGMMSGCGPVRRIFAAVVIGA